MSEWQRKLSPSLFRTLALTFTLLLLCRKYCLYEWLDSLPGRTSGGPVTAGKKSKSKSAVIKEFAAELNRIALNTGQSTFTHAQLVQVYAAKFGTCGDVGVNEVLEAMNHLGHLLKKPGNQYKLMST